MKTQINYSIETTDQLARAFGQVLKKWLNAGELLVILERNKNEEDPNICHSHDFCDANMAMDKAFKQTTGHHCRAVSSRATEDQKNADNELWNEAWALAKANNFFLI